MQNSTAIAVPSAAVSGYAAAVLEVRDLTIRFDSAEPVVEGLSLLLQPGRVLALVGESGSGKTLTALAMIGLLPNGAQVLRGEILLNGDNVIKMSARALRDMRGKDVGFVFQEPLTAFNPLLTIGRQVCEVLRRHRALSGRGSWAATIQRLGEAALHDAARVARMYPHELSGGMRQRAMIAMAIAARPTLVIADEPTTALDVTVQAEVLKTLDQVTRGAGRSLLLITHDLGVVHAIADDVVVMHRGRCVESGPAGVVLRRPAHDVTRGLLMAAPRIRDDPAPRAVEVVGALSAGPAC